MFNQIKAKITNLILNFDDVGWFEYRSFEESDLDAYTESIISLGLSESEMLKLKFMYRLWKGVRLRVLLLRKFALPLSEEEFPGTLSDEKLPWFSTFLHLQKVETQFWFTVLSFKRKNKGFACVINYLHVFFFVNKTVFVLI